MKNIIIGVLAFVLIMFFYNEAIMQPLIMFQIAVHETCHSLMALITGGSVKELNVNASHSGNVISSGGSVFLISIAGYIGTSFIGMLLLKFSAKNMGYVILWFVSIITILFGIIYSSWLSWELYAIIFISGLMLWNKYENETALFVGFFLCFSSFIDLKMYMFAIPTRTDAGILARELGSELLTLPISILIASISLLFVYWGMKHFIKIK